MTLETLFGHWLESLASRGRKPATVRTAARHAKVICRLLGGRRLAAEIRPLDVEALTTARLAESARSTTNATLRNLKAALRWGERMEIIPRACRVELLREGRKLPIVLTDEEVERLLWDESGLPGLAAALAVDAGLRHQEILHLQWQDIDFTEQLVRVRAKPNWTPKSYHEREIPMTARLQRALIYAFRKGAPRSQDSHGHWIFPGSNGKPMADIGRQIADLFKAALLYDSCEAPGLHTLRRTWATRLAGVTDLETLRQLGGWADLATVQYYVTSTTERKRAAIAKIG